MLIEEKNMLIKIAFLQLLPGPSLEHQLKAGIEACRKAKAKEADIGIAGGIGEGLLIRHGEVIKKLPEDQLLSALKEEIERM